MVPKIPNPPPKPDPELQPPMVINFKISKKQAPTFAVRFLISCLIAILFLLAIAGFSILCTFQPIIGMGLLLITFVLLSAYAMSFDERYWGGE
jgi:fatty acid desaturase